MPSLDEELIAFVKCEYVDPELKGRYLPMWVRLLHAERVLTKHQANAWVMSVDLAHEVAAYCNGDPEWQTIVMTAGDLKSKPLAVTYSVVEYKLV